MTFFNKVIANESKNRMSVWNISTVMAPNLFFSRGRHSDREQLLLANTAAHVLRLMLKYQKILWKVGGRVAALGVPWKPTSTGSVKEVLLAGGNPRPGPWWPGIQVAQVPVISSCSSLHSAGSSSPVSQAQRKKVLRSILSDMNTYKPLSPPLLSNQYSLTAPSAVTL